MEFLKPYMTRKNIIWIIVIILSALALWRLLSPKTIEEKVPETKVKTVQTITFGEWRPDSSREVLATLSSTGDINIAADVSGTIDNVFVSIGDAVEKGQLLATFRQTNDLTQVTYENALSTLAVVRVSAQNTITSSEIALQTAQAQLEQTVQTQDQIYRQVFESLRTQANNSETTASNALDWADRILGASTRFRYQNYDADRSQIGSTDQITKQATKNMVEELVREQPNLSQLPSFKPTDQDVIVYGETRLRFLKEVQEVVRNMDGLIRRTDLTGDLTLADKNIFQTEAETFSSKVDAGFLSLESAIQTAKTQNQTRRLAILTAENAVRNAEASLSLAQAQSKSSVSSAQNQLKSTQVSKNDLEVRAPFAGKITEKFINNFDQVRMGENLFSLVSETIAPKVVGFVTKDELDRLLTKDTVKVLLSNNQTIEVKQSYLSFKTDAESQKIQVEFQLDTFPEGVLVGSFAKILVPSQNGKVNLVPITALSFEPDGAEVLIKGENDIAKRVKVQYGKIVGDAVEIVGGLEKGTKVLQYRNRTHAGEIINEQ